MTYVTSQHCFTDFVLKQLAALPGVTARAMLGGAGLYAGGRFFGIIYHDRLYLRTYADTISDYIEAGMNFFCSDDTQQTLENYYEVPTDVIDSRRRLIEWARRAMSA